MFPTVFSSESSSNRGLLTRLNNASCCLACAHSRVTLVTWTSLLIGQCLALSVIKHSRLILGIENGRKSRFLPFLL